MSDGCFDPFSHLTVPNSDLYRQVMAAFVAAKQRFVVHLRPEDVYEVIAQTSPTVAPEAVADGLGKLVEWGNLRADPDTGRVTTLEDFWRARFLYQLTQRGEAVERALTTYDEHLGRRGSLQAVALSDIAEQLRALRLLARDAAPDPARVSLLLRDLVGRFGDLADNAQAFMGSLQRTIDLYDADVDSFRAYKDQLVDYLERFIKDLVTIGGEIARLLGELDRGDVQRLLEIVAVRDAEDAAPGASLNADDIGDQRAEAVAVGVATWQGRWSGLRQWFVAGTGHPSQAKLLRTRARAAIPQLLAVVATLNERRAGRSDRSADLRTLACWFAEAPDEVAMHRLWRVAFGLAGSRHLTLDADTLLAREENPVSPSLPWAAAPPLRISPRLRRTGSYERRGRANRIVDRTESRRALARLAAAEAQQTATARARLATGGPVRLADLGELDLESFGLFLSLLGDALGARRPGRPSVTTTTTDGTMRIALTAVDGGARVPIHTPAGALWGPDHLIEIVDLAPAVASTPMKAAA